MDKRMLLFVVLMVLGACGSSALALDLLGTPTAGLAASQWEVGSEYMFSDLSVEVEKNPNEEDLQTNKACGKIGYGVTDNWEVFVRLGVANANAEWLPDDIDTGSTEFACSAGTKVTFLEGDTCKWGALFSWSQMKSEDKSPAFGVWSQVDFDEFQIAVGPTVTVSEGLCVYCGVQYQWLDGDACEFSGTFDIDSEGYGGFVGAEFHLNDNAALTTEVQYTDDAVGVGAGLLWRI